MNPTAIRGTLPVLLTAIVLRVMLAPFTGHPYDLSIWMAAGRNVAYLRSPYELNPHLGYPPLWALWCGAAYVLSGLIPPPNVFFYVFLIKLPIIVADTAIALLLTSGPIHGTTSIHRRDYRGLSPIARAELFLFNPHTIIVGVVWGMMDNLVVLLIVLMTIALTRGKYLWAGMLLALSISLKLYPILFLPICLVYLIKNAQSVEKILRFLVALSATAFSVVTFPFLILNWDTRGLLGVLLAQGARIPGGISPIGILTYLPQIGVANIGPFSVLDLSENIWLRLLWIPVTIIGALFYYHRGKFSKMGDLFDGLLLTYGIYILVAPWVSEPNTETLLVLMLFAAASKGLKLRQYGAYLVGSIIVSALIVLHVPVTSFLILVSAIDPTPLLRFGAPILPWIVLAFGAYCLFVIVSTGHNMRRTFTGTKVDA